MQGRRHSVVDVDQPRAGGHHESFLAFHHPLQQHGDSLHQDDVRQTVAGELEEVRVGFGHPHVRADLVEQHQFLVHAGQFDADGLDLLFRPDGGLVVEGDQPEHLAEVFDVPPGTGRRRRTRRQSSRGAGSRGASQIDDHGADGMTIPRDHDRHQQGRSNQQTPLGELPDGDLDAVVPLLLDPGQDAPAHFLQLFGMTLEQTGIHQDGNLARRPSPRRN